MKIFFKGDEHISINLDDAIFQGLKIWFLSKAIDCENRRINPQSPVIDILNLIHSPPPGRWASLMSSKGFEIKEGDIPKQLDEISKLSVDDVNLAFRARNRSPSEHEQKDVKTYRSKQEHRDNSVRGHSPRENNAYYATEIDNRPSRPAEYQSLLNDINSLVGLEVVKTKVEEIVDFMIINEEKKKLGLPVGAISNHMIFTGNPGTGKTTIARKLGKIFKHLGVVSKGHFVEVDRQSLVAGYLGQTASKTKNAIESAIGGILFIDEAYMLAPGISGDQFGQEAIDTLVATMENLREDLIVIVAGYEEEMRNFISSNPGLRSRFSAELKFEDYTKNEMKQIFLQMVINSGHRIGDICDDLLDEIFLNVERKKGKNFGNGREVRNIFEKILLRQNQRLVRNKNRTNSNLMEFLPCDLEAVLEENAIPNAINTDSNKCHIGSMIGIHSVKEEIKKIIALAKVRQIRNQHGLTSPRSSLHMVFSGNPGTGKTTVARHLAKELYSIGALARDSLVEVSRSDLVAGYVGQTSLKTLQQLERAIGGILFIDEAYTLASKNKDDFGNEAIDTILTFMENHKDEILIIVAGYKDEMQVFLNSNPGLSSRFNRFINFEDYDTKSLTLIFNTFANESQYKIEPRFASKLESVIKELHSARSRTFGNGRAIRNLFEKVVDKQAVRIANQKNLLPADIVTLIPDDIDIEMIADMS